MYKYITSIFSVILLFNISTNCLFAQEILQKSNDSKNFRRRLEVGAGCRIGHKSEEADGYLISVILDFSKITSPHTEFSIRTSPIFTYIQDDNEDTVYGIGVGPALRVYFKESFCKSPYLEFHEMVYLHQGKFEDNDSNINFNSGIAIGYQINNNWDASIRFSHFSNANLKENNDSTNIISFGLGYKF